MNSKLKNIQNWPALARQAQWSALVMAKLCGVSVRTLHRYFLKRFHKNTKTWLAGQRDHITSKMLHDGLTIKETATTLGYKQQTNFTRHYKHQMGVCPSLFAGVIAPSKPRLSAND